MIFEVTFEEFKKYVYVPNNDILKELYSIYQENGYEWIYEDMEIGEIESNIVIFDDEQEATDYFEVDDISDLERIYHIVYADNKIIVLTY